MFRWILIEHFLHDLRYAARTLRKNVIFSGVAILTFALGIGTNTAIFSVVNATLLRPLPYPQPDRIVHLSFAWKTGELNDALSLRDFVFYRDHDGAFQATAGYRGAATVSLKRTDRPEWIKCISVTDSFFHVLGIHPAQGRPFIVDDTLSGGDYAAVLSDSLWHRSFAGDPAVIGHKIELNNLSYTVVGVMPPNFTFVGQPADIFVSLHSGHTVADTGMNTRVIARLNPHITLKQAQVETNAVFEEFRRQGLSQAGQKGIQLERYQRWIAGDFGTSVLMLFGAVCLLLVVACANVASLLLARADSRRRELSIRIAIGSRRSQLLQQLLAEGLLIALAGGIAGLLAAEAALRSLISFIPWDAPLTSKVDLDFRVLAFTTIVILSTGLVFGLVSFWQISGLDLHASLRQSSSRGLSMKSTNRGRSLLIIGEIALSLMLLVGAGLLIESIYVLHQQRLGFDGHNVYTMLTPFESGARLTPTQTWNFEQRVLGQLNRIPGVSSAAAVSDLPLSGSDNLPMQHEGHPEHSIGGMEYRAISPQYFKTMRIPVIQGRAFFDSDTMSSTSVAIVSESVARAWWDGSSPIGERILVGVYKGHKFPEILEQPRQVVGVVGDVKNLAVDETVPTTVYVPASQLPRVSNSSAWVIRVNGQSSLAGELPKAVVAVEPQQRVVDLQPMMNIVTRSVARPTFDASLVSTFALFALALTAIGIYGLISFQVTRRTRDIGIQMALGAERRTVLLAIMREALLVAGIGIAIGVSGAIAVSRFLASLVVGTRGNMPVLYITVSVLVLLVAVLAAYVPARRASKVDPLIALRYE